MSRSDANVPIEDVLDPLIGQWLKLRLLGILPARGAVSAVRVAAAATAIAEDRLVLLACLAETEQDAFAVVAADGHYGRFFQSAADSARLADQLNEEILAEIRRLAAPRPAGDGTGPLTIADREVAAWMRLWILGVPSQLETKAGWRRTARGNPTTAMVLRVAAAAVIDAADRDRLLDYLGESEADALAALAGDSHYGRIWSEGGSGTLRALLQQEIAARRRSQALAERRAP